MYTSGKSAAGARSICASMTIQSSDTPYLSFFFGGGGLGGGRREELVGK